MVNRLKNIFNSYVAEISILVIICCMIATSIPMKYEGGWTGMAVAAALTGGAVTLALLIWATYMLISNKEAREMPAKSRLIVEACSSLLMMYWIYLVYSLTIALIWLPLFLWVLWTDLRSTRQAAQ